MSEEYLDIVDENGNLTGEKELRSIVHAKGLWHRTVHVYFYRKQNNNIELLAHLRSKNKRSNPNKWNPCFGGHVESGQTKEEAAERETAEEIGIKIEIEKALRGLNSSYDGISNREIIQEYYYDFRGSLDELSFDDEEVQKVQWMNEDEFVKSMQNNPEIWPERQVYISRVFRDLEKKLKKETS